MKTDDLFLCCCIMSSDDDQLVTADIYAGFDSDFNLVIMLVYDDFDHPHRNTTTCAIVRKDEAYRLSRRLRVPMTKLPDVIYDSMDHYGNIVNATPSQVRACFKEITDSLVADRCHFRISSRAEARN